MKNAKLLSVVGLISCLIVWARWIPHESNFSPVLALFILSGFVGRGRWFSFVLPASAMMLTDLFLGLYSSLTLTYLPLLLLVALGRLAQGKWSHIYGLGLIGTVGFFLLSNFGVWWLGQPALYPYTLSGLLDCYTMALPFFRATLVSTFVSLASAHALFWLFSKFSLLPTDIVARR